MACIEKIYSVSALVGTSACNANCKFSPSRMNMWRIKHWLHTHAKLCHGHIWGGGVYDYNGVLVRMTDYVTKHNPNKDYVRQLVVFQDGMVAYSWIKEGAICFMP